MGKVVIDIIAGARPNFMKIASIITSLEERNVKGGCLQYRLVHTGQHYDPRMSSEFFEQLGIPRPDVNLKVGSGNQSEQTGAIMTRYEELLTRSGCDLCLVVGDVTSTMACSIVAKKKGIPVAHVEAGIRSGDLSMPEEINRIVTDSITNFFFTTSEFANQNLLKTGVSPDSIFFVGNTMIDTLLKNMGQLRPPVFWKQKELKPQEYIVMTLHRPANVDSKEILSEFLRAIGQGARNLPVIFPVHPRTKKNLEGMRDIPTNIHMVEPQAYLEFNYLVKNSFAVITDSGGITEETTVMDVPCLTLRNSTERPETVSQGTNELVGTDAKKLESSLDLLFSGRWKRGSIPENWDGRAGDRIVEKLEELVADGTWRTRSHSIL